MLLALAACATGSPSSFSYTAPPPSSEERYCAWYGDAREGILYFGQAAFWSAARDPESGRLEPRADLERVGPQPIGRFDLRRRRLLDPLEVGAPGARSGVWDVLAHPNGRLYFTTLFESAGSLDVSTGTLRRFEALGGGLNELALGPDGNLLVSRYGTGDDSGADGSVVLFDPEGRPLGEYAIVPPPGFQAAPKTVAFDPQRGEIWVTTDLLPRAGGAARHDAYVLDTAGHEQRRIPEPEIQFVAFAEDGTGYRAEVTGHELWLQVVLPTRRAEAGPRVLLDDAFATEFDFVQDIQIASNAGAVVTRWSGWIHVVDPSGTVQTLRLPELDPAGLYYTGALANGSVCATYCADVTVVCRNFPRH